MDDSKLNRLEIIDHRTDKFNQSAGRQVIVSGPAYNQPDDVDIKLSYQDDGKTLKIFISNKEQAE